MPSQIRADSSFGIVPLVLSILSPSYLLHVVGFSLPSSEPFIIYCEHHLGEIRGEVSSSTWSRANM
jgi:hypothetical protein